LKLPATGGKLGGTGFPARETSLQTAKRPATGSVNIENAGAPRSGTSRPGAAEKVVPAVPQIAGFKELALSLGLKQDTLSSSLLSFIHFFSLPLDPKLIQKLRQEVLSLNISQKDPEQRSTGGKSSADRIQAGALAAAAAAGKGITLSTEALEKYAAAIAGDEQDGDDTGHDGGSADSGAGSAQGDSDGGQSETGHYGKEHAGQQDGGGQTNGKRHPKDALSPEQIRDMVEKIEGQSPLLNILNKIPGKDGRRWINLPFSFISGDIDFKVSLRILLADTNTIPWKAEYLALDVTAGTCELCAPRRWSFILEGGGKSSGTPVFDRAVVGIHPPPEQPAALEGKLRELLGAIAGETSFCVD
jgi:hypothetical protein